MDALKLRKKLVSLWSPLHLTEKDFDVHICDMSWNPDAVVGIFFASDCRDHTWDLYCRANDVEAPYPNQVLVVSPEADHLGNYLHTALHEFAHCVRHSLSALYPDMPSAKEDADEMIRRVSMREGVSKTQVHHYAKAIRGYYKRRRHERKESLSSIEKAIFPARRRNAKKATPPLFGNYAQSYYQYDAAHDPLFYLIFYLLDRKAHDSNFYGSRTAPKLSRTF